MELSFMILLLLAFSEVSCCPDSCSCSLMTTECFFNTCAADLPYEETYILEIHGFLCKNQRELLTSSPSFANTLIRLHDDSCLDIPNCRSKVVVTTEGWPVIIPPPLLPRDPEDVYEFGEGQLPNDDDDDIDPEILQPNPPKPNPPEPAVEPVLEPRGDDDDHPEPEPGPQPPSEDETFEDNGDLVGGENDEVVTTTATPPSNSDGVTDSTDSEVTTTDLPMDNPSSAAAWLTRQVGVLTLGVIGVCLLLAVICLTWMYCRIRKRLVAAKKEKGSDEDLSRVQEVGRNNDNRNLLSDMENGQETTAALPLSNMGEARAGSSESITVFDKEQVWKNPTKRTPRPQSRKDR